MTGICSAPSIHWIKGAGMATLAESECLMLYSAYFHTGTTVEACSSYEDLDVLIRELLNTALEMGNSLSQSWVIYSEDGVLCATGIVEPDSELSGTVTVYRYHVIAGIDPFSPMHTYRVTYVLGADGLWDHTDVTLLA